MPFWRLYDYRTQEGTYPIRDWYAAQDERVQAEFDATVIVLKATKDWADVKSFKAYNKPQFLGLGQMMFKVIYNAKTRRQFRVVGRLGKEQREFTFLVGFRKSGRSSDPPNALENAVKMRMQLEEGKGSIHEHV